MSEDKRLNEVIRIQKRPNNFVMMDKGFLENNSLSWKAKGILAYLLSKPDNWKVIVKDLVNHATDGKASVYSGLNELKAEGHYRKVPVRSETGRRISHWEGTISEVPMESLENIGNSLLTDFQEIENQDIDNQDIENRERNNNYINNNDFNNNQSSLSGKKRRQDETRQSIETYRQTVHENIGYENLKQSHKGDIKLVDEMVLIILDVLLSEGDYITVGREDKPRELVKQQLLKLDYCCIEYVLEQFKAQSNRISKKKQYILTMLYNCRMEMDAHFTNWVQSDLINGRLSEDA